MSDDLAPLVESLMRLMDKHEMAELEVERNGLKIRLHKQGTAAPTVVPAPYPMLPPMLSPVMSGAPATPTSAASAPPPAPSSGGPKAGWPAVTSPMVGTVYLQQKPEEPPFVNVGDDVRADMTVCLIEAMKVFNEIKAGHDGVIAEVLVKNGQPVEYNQPLFLIKPKAD